jgi:methylenetetrahydrofolate dehydrogenase (NADP+)/methenyltetrahydrofolate cyclohydrolase
MTARIIDGKTIAADLRADIGRDVASLPFQPGLAVVLVGEDPASAVYVRNKGEATKAAGMASFDHRLSVDTTQADLLALIGRLNGDPSVHGILVQLPLPAHIDPAAVIDAIDPDKDVDGFHVVNAGRLAVGRPGFVPCTPLGCRMLLDDTIGPLAGLRAVVLGRSNIVGKPMAHLLLQADCTVTLCHSRTRDLAAVTRQADIIIAAIGRPNFLGADHVREGAVVIDVGINRVDDESDPRGYRLVGDVDFAAVAPKCRAITPVPGGVGPMTIAMLMRNTVRAASVFFVPS